MNTRPVSQNLYRRNANGVITCERVESSRVGLNARIMQENGWTQADMIDKAQKQFVAGWPNKTVCWYGDLGVGEN